MGFLAPWFMAGLLAIGLPVYVHLLRKQTSEPRPISSLMFFEQGTQSSVRHRRLRYYLLFALRTLLVLLLALTFAQPFLRHRSVLASDKLLVVAIDDSYSMNAGPANASRLDDAKRQALALLDGKHAGQKAQVMALGGQLEVLTQPIQDIAELKAAVASIGPGYGHGSFGELGRGMRAMAETVHTPVDLHLFSDMQQANMPGNFADMVLPGNVQLTLHPVGPQTATPNWTVESVEAPAQVVDTKKARVVAVIAGHETPAATENVSLMVNGKPVATKKVDVPANGHVTVVFDGLDVPYGESRCAVRVESTDGFTQDNESLFAVKRADPERVLFVHQAGDTRSPLYFGTALGSADQASFVLQSITPEQAADIDPSKYAFVALSDVPFIPSILENALTRNVQSGGGVLVLAGTADAHRQHLPVFGGESQEGIYYGRNGGSTKLGDADSVYPPLRDAAAWSGANFFYASKIDPGKARVAAKLADGTPLLIDKQMGEGHVLLFASGFDNITNDLPLSPAFVAFVDRTARYLSGEEAMSGARVVDSYVQLRSPDTAAAAAGKTAANNVDIIGPDGKHPLSLSEAATATSFRLTQAGFYNVRFGNGRSALIAVNPDPRESDLQPIPADILKLWTGAGATQQGQQQATSEQTATISPLWWWFMLLLTITALAESVVASQYLGTQREQL